MSSNADDKSILETRLSRILGWDDAGEEMLEMLLSMESNEDLLEYLEQLLGRSDDTIHQFITDVSKFRQGRQISSEPITPVDKLKTTLVSSDIKLMNREPKPRELKNANGSSTNQPKSSNVSKESKLKSKKATRTKPVRGKVKNQNKTSTISTDNTQAIIEEKHVVKKEIPVVTSPVVKTSIDEKISTDITSVSKIAQKIAAKPSLPKKGKAKTVCGCFGTKYKAIANCLNCGRILCEKEGYGYCPHCGSLVEKVEPTTRTGDREMDLATMHKERLLKFDREFTRRTVIYDDQSDYYSNSTSMWIDETERKVESQKDEERRQTIHERQKQTLDIVF